MGSLSPIHWFAVALIVILLFGPGRLAGLGKGLADGIRNLKRGLADDRPHTPELDDRRS